MSMTSAVNGLFSCDATKLMLQCTMGTCAILIPDNEDADMRNSRFFSNRPGVTKDVKFYKTLTVLLDQGVDTRILSEDYVTLWLG